MEKVDVLVATYKTNIKYLVKQIDSILNQTYTNINVIISDDNSQDEELKQILEQYEAQDKRVTVYFQEENLGYIQNFNFLLEKSTSAYICFSDHDDIWYPQKIEKSLEKLKKENVDLVYVNARQIDENDNVIKEDYFRYKNMPLINKKSKLAISRYIGIGCSQLFTKDVKEKAIPFKKSVMAQDWLVSFIANENKGITYIKEPLFDYRLHQTNIFGGRSLKQNINRWKQENGTSHESYLKYRKQNVIDKAYLSGAKMCLDYCENSEDKDFINKLITYYNSIEKSKFINFHIFKYFKFLGGKNLGKKMLKEFIIFHFPILGQLIWKFN